LFYLQNLLTGRSAVFTKPHQVKQIKKPLTNMVSGFSGLKILFMRFFAAYSQFCTALGTAGSKNTTAVCRCHALFKPVFVFSFSLRWLKGTFHDIKLLIVFILKNGLQM
jgi:hypothetical protein